MTNITIPITKDYVSDWTLWEAVRELAQNTLDHSDKSGTKPKITYKKKTETLIFTSVGAKLSRSSLALGCSNKGDESRGKFGEGYKLAIVVLLRLGYRVSICNANEVWESSFEYSEIFENDLLNIRIKEGNESSTDLTIQVSGVSAHDAKSIANKIILNRDSVVGYHTDKGSILTEERYRGKVYVGGLYVCNPNISLEHGYDFNPAEVALGRDRGLMDSFDVQWLASHLWSIASTKSSKALDTAANLATSTSSDIPYIGSVGASSVVVERIVSTFHSQHSDKAIPVTSQEEYNEVLKKYDDAVPIITNISVQDIVTDSEAGIAAKRNLKERVVDTPYVAVSKLLDTYNMKGGEFTSVLLAKSKTWETAK